MRGTLLAYERHRASEDWFRAPGEQDLTAHVNFSALDLYGQRNQLLRMGFASQSNFLLALARHGNFADLQSSEMSEAEQTQRRLLFKTLINPEGMGETFQVLVQHKGLDPGDLAGLQAL
jgi:SAM-dependent MidA family methyltransferase